MWNLVIALLPLFLALIWILFSLSKDVISIYGIGFLIKNIVSGIIVSIWIFYWILYV
jgi:hypothetical protein